MALLICLVVEVRREKRTCGAPSGREVGLSVGFLSSPPLVLKQEGAAAEGLAAPLGAGFLHKGLTHVPPVRVGHHDCVLRGVLCVGRATSSVVGWWLELCTCPCHDFFVPSTERGQGRGQGAQGATGAGA